MRPVKGEKLFPALYTYSEILKEYRGNNAIKVLFNRTKKQIKVVPNCTQPLGYTILNLRYSTVLFLDEHWGKYIQHFKPKQ